MSSNEKLLLVVVVVVLVIAFWMGCSKKQENLSDDDTQHLMHIVKTGEVRPEHMNKKVCVNVGDLVELRNNVKSLLSRNEEDIHDMGNHIKNKLHFVK